jgi:hypothetical protein
VRRPVTTNREAVWFGLDATGGLIYLIGLYCMVALTLNAVDVPVPDDTPA